MESVEFKKGYLIGYAKAMQRMKDIVTRYEKKSYKCMDDSMDDDCYIFWDGFHNCSENILREIEYESKGR